MTRRIALESLLLPLLLLAGTVRLSAQDRWDGILDQYEEICDRCIDMRQRIAGGESVPDRSVTALLQELAALRKTLQEASGTMSKRQRTRFRAIQQRYADASGATSAPASPTEADRPKTPSTPSKHTPPATSRQIAAEPAPVVRERLRLPALSLPITASASPLSSTEPDIRLADPASILPSYDRDPNYPQKWSADLLVLYAHGSASSYGLMAAVSYRQRWGFWLAGRSNFTAMGHSYDCRSDGTADDGRFWGNGQSRYGVFSVAGGPLWRPLPWLGIYAGAGYTKEELDWQDAKDRWARVTDYSTAGLCGDAGVLITWKHLSFAAGCSWRTYATLTLALGVHF